MKKLTVEEARAYSLRLIWFGFWITIIPLTLAFLLSLFKFDSAESALNAESESPLAMFNAGSALDLLMSIWPVCLALGGIAAIAGLSVLISLMVDISGETDGTLKLLGFELPIRVEGFAFVFLLLFLIGGIAIHYLEMDDIDQRLDQYTKMRNDIMEATSKSNENLIKIENLEKQNKMMKEILVAQIDDLSFQLLLEINCGNKDLRRVTWENNEKSGIDAFVPSTSQSEIQGKPLPVFRNTNLIYIGQRVHSQRGGLENAVSLKFRSEGENLVLTIFPEKRALRDLCNPRVQEVAEGESARGRAEPGQQAASNVGISPDLE